LAAPADGAELAAQVRAGAVELGITDAGRANHGLEVHPLAEQAVYAVSAPVRPRPTGPLRLREVAGVPLVLSPTGSSVRDVVDVALADAGVDPEVAVETAQRDALIPLVLAGAGTAFLPETLARAAERLGAIVRETTPRLRRRVVVVHRPDELGPAASRFLALAQGA
jgi:DNA-binding transcriptional LysR family regulator